MRKEEYEGGVMIHSGYDCGLRVTEMSFLDFDKIKITQ